MKKTLLLVLFVAAVTLAGCKKGPPVEPSIISDTYLPLTKGNTWIYNDNTGGVTDIRALTVTGATTQINGKTYYDLNIQSQADGPETGYFYAGDHIYALRQVSSDSSITIEVQLGDDNQDVGYSWTSYPTDDGTVEGYPAQLINTIREKGVSKMVNGRNYNNVIHTQAALQYDVGSGFTTTGTYDFFLAKGVGLIEEDLTIDGAIYESQTLSSYTIK